MPSRTASGVPPTSVATTGRDAAIASSTEFGNASEVEQSTETSNNPWRFGSCGRSPARWTRSRDPQHSGQRLDAAALGAVADEHAVQRGIARRSIAIARRSVA